MTVTEHYASRDHAVDAESTTLKVNSTLLRLRSHQGFSNNKVRAGKLLGVSRGYILRRVLGTSASYDATSTE